MKISDTQYLHNTTIFTNSWLVENKPLMILFGTGDEQITFLQKNMNLNKLNTKIIGQDIYGDGIRSLLTFNNLIILNDDNRGLLGYEGFVPEQFANWPTELKVGVFNKVMFLYSSYFSNINYMYKESIKYENYEQFYQYRERAAKATFSFYENDRELMTLYKEHSSPSVSIWELLMAAYDYKIYNQFLEKYLPRLKKFLKSQPTYCPYLECKPGFFETYGNITDGSSWKCQLCPKNYIKAIYGNNEKCTPCTGKLNVDNGKRTKCIDPYTDKNLNVFKSEKIFIMALCLVGFFLTSSTIILFIVKQSSPVVKTSDFLLSILHMILLCLIFVVICIFLLTQHTTKAYCNTKLFANTILYTANVGIIFIKSQKLLQAFLSKLRLTSSQKSRTVYIQAFTVLMLLISIL